VLWCYSLYIPLLTERDNSVGEGYKHVAPPEQGPDNNKTFRAKPRRPEPLKRVLQFGEPFQGWMLILLI